MLGNHASRNGVKSSSLTIAVLVVVSHPVSAQVATFQGLGDFPGGGFYSEANGVSADGSTVVGFSRHTRNEAFVWTFSGGMVGLGNQPGAELIYPSYGHAISGDGSVIIGTGSSSTNTEAFLWTADTGIIGLSLQPGTQAVDKAGDRSQ